MDNISQSVNLELHAVPERNVMNVMVPFKNMCDVIKIELDNFAVRTSQRVARMSQSDRPRNFNYFIIIPSTLKTSLTHLIL